MEARAKAEEEIAEFRRRVNISSGAQTFYISGDSTATLLNAAFLDTIDYGASFKYVQELVEKKPATPTHEIHLVGQPALTGWVFKLAQRLQEIFAATIGVMLLLLVFYMGNVTSTVMPLVSAAVAGLGLRRRWYIGTPD